MAAVARALYVQQRDTSFALTRRALLRPDYSNPASAFNRFIGRYQAELDEMPENLLRQIEIHDDPIQTAASVVVVCKAYRTQIALEVLSKCLA
jgi:uncharacterized protein YeaO (DUF488 family)